jgi:hypothetical protein
MRGNPSTASLKPPLKNDPAHGTRRTQRPIRLNWPLIELKDTLL